MFVFVASVHHTGTQFVQKLFEDMDYQVTDLTPKEAGNSANYFHRCHISDSIMTELMMWLETDTPLIVPLRHPMEVARSWLARKKPIADMVRQFELLFEVVDPFGPLYLPIDHAKRETYLSLIAEACDHDINTNWRKVSSKVVGSEHPAQLKPVAPGFEDYEHLGRLHESKLLQRFYPDRWLL